MDLSGVIWLYHIDVDRFKFILGRIHTMAFEYQVTSNTLFCNSKVSSSRCVHGIRIVPSISEAPSKDFISTLLWDGPFFGKGKVPIHAASIHEIAWKWKVAWASLLERKGNHDRPSTSFRQVREIRRHVTRYKLKEDGNSLITETTKIESNCASQITH